MNVYDASIQRIETIFRNFDNVSVSFSGGKDSGVMLNLTALVARRLKRRFTVMHLDYEAQYQATTDYVQRAFQAVADVAEIHHVCVPFKVTTCTSMHQSYWRPWQKDLREIWVRPLPETSCTHYPWFKPSMWDYEFQERWGTEYHNFKHAKRTAILVGIRTDESLNRWRAIHKERSTTFKNLEWTKQVSEGVYNCYPIFDWATEDIWTANGRFGWDYNRLYDLFHQAGVPIHAMRVASPFLGTAQSSLHLYRIIEPHTWGKLVSRVNGVNFTGIYGGTTAMGWKSITKPKHLTWKEYCEFLLSTLPAEVADNYRAKLETSIKFWRERGGVMASETIAQLQAEGVNIELAEHNYPTDKQAVRMEYLDDTEADDFQHIPTYKRMCVCILKNDHLCKYMGFTLTKQETERRKAAIEHYQNIL